MLAGPSREVSRGLHLLSAAPGPDLNLNGPKRPEVRRQGLKRRQPLRYVARVDGAVDFVTIVEQTLDAVFHTVSFAVMHRDIMQRGSRNKMSVDNVIRPYFLDIDAQDRLFLHQSLDEIIDSGTLILGPFTDRFERAFAAYANARHAISLNSATSALEVQLRLAGVQGKLVAVPTNTNFATVAAIIHAGGVPVLLDMDPRTFVPSLEVLLDAHQRHPSLCGVTWVHIGGVITPEMPAIARYCRDHGLFLIEDCAHAHGSASAGIQAGSFGVSGAFSFFPTKVMTTMEGGMITTNDEDYAALVRSYRNQGKRAGNYNTLHIDLGNSWRLSEFAAAFGLAQLAKLDRMIERRSDVALIYAKSFEKMGIEYVDSSHMDRCSHYKFIGVLPDGIELSQLKARLAERGVVLGGGVYETPCHAQPVFGHLRRADEVFPVADALCHRQFCLPITSGMTTTNAREVVDALCQALH